MQTIGQCQHKLLLTTQEKSLKHQPPGLCHSSLSTYYNMVLLWSLKKKYATTGKKKVPLPFKGSHKLYSLLPVFISKLIFKKFIKNQHYVDINYFKKKEKAKNCVKCSFYNHVLIFFPFTFTTKEVSFHWFYSKGKHRKSLFLHRGVKSWTRNLFPHRTFQMECCNFASLRQNEEYFCQASHRALPLWPFW